MIDPRGSTSRGGGPVAGTKAGSEATGGAARTVRHETSIDADPSRVWEAWTDPERIAGWFVDRAVGHPEEDGRVTWAWDRFGLEVAQEVVAVDPPHRLVLRPEGLEGGARVLEVRLEARSGGTVVRVVESGFSTAAEADGADSGWVMALTVLGHYVTRYFGRSRSEIQAFAPIPARCRAIRSYYREPERLSQWLTSPGAGAAEASSADALALRDGRTVTGPVLVEAGDEVARAWSEVEGVLELKAFPSPDGGCTVGLRAMSWGLPQDELDTYEPVLKRAVDHLVERLSG